MSRKFIAAVLAVSTTIAALSAAPARAASNEDIARILGAAATIFIIGKAIENSRDDRDDKKKDRYETHGSHGKKPVYQNNYHKPLPQVVPRHVQPQRRVSALPAQCVQRVTGAKANRVVMERCLERNYRSARDLPRACKMTVSKQRGRTGAYALPCLRQRGYTVAQK